MYPVSAAQPKSKSLNQNFLSKHFNQTNCSRIKNAVKIKPLIFYILF